MTKIYEIFEMMTICCSLITSNGFVAVLTRNGFKNKMDKCDSYLIMVMEYLNGRARTGHPNSRSSQILFPNSH